MRLFFLIVIISFTSASNAQNFDARGFDVSLNGYIFLTNDGLFFQPLDFQSSKDFISSINKTSFKIEESREIMYSEILQGIGNKILVKKYFEDTIAKNIKVSNTDTISYFKCSIAIGMQFFDTSYTSFSEVGYGFVQNNQLIYYGNLAIRNQLYKIIPEDVKVLEQFYNSYQKKKMYPPEWLRVLYSQRKIKRKKLQAVGKSAI